MFPLCQYELDFPSAFTPIIQSFEDFVTWRVMPLHKRFYFVIFDYVMEPYICMSVAQEGALANLERHFNGLKISLAC